MNQYKNNEKNKDLTKELYNYFVAWSLNSSTHGIPMVLFNYFVLKIYI
jgi:hypothetical protein